MVLDDLDVYCCLTEKEVVDYYRPLRQNPKGQKRLAKYVKAAIRNKTASPDEGTFLQKEETAYGRQGVIRQTS
jgi:molybdenum cofactor biosynthesis enzyme MoaA